MSSGASNYDNIIEIHNNVDPNLPPNSKKEQTTIDGIVDQFINSIIADMRETCDSITEILGIESRVFAELSTLYSKVPTWLLSGVSRKAIPIKCSLEKLFPDVSVDIAYDPQAGKTELEIIREYVETLCIFQSKQEELQNATEKLVGYIEQLMTISENENGIRRLRYRQDEIVSILKALLENYTNIV